MKGSGNTGSGRLLRIALLLFVFALSLRWFFLQALPEAAGPFNPFYTGDTPTWLSYASAIQSAQPFDLGLPMRPPGVAYLVAAIWDGSEKGLVFLQLAWAAMGAAVVVLFFIAAWRSFGLRVATVAGLAAAASSGLMVLSTSINNETPYLLLVMSSFVLWQPLRSRPGWAVIVAWSLLQGLACLIRVEHVLFVALSSLYLAWVWARTPGQRAAWRMLAGRTVLLAVVFLLPLVPWQLHIFSQIEQFNRQPLPTNRAAEQAYQELEQALAGLRWTKEAAQIRDGLPVFSQRSLGNFVAATVAMRGGQEVQARDLAIIEQAFGYLPEPVDAHPFITVYGGLNFRLANNPWASGGFTRAPLETPPPFEGGRWRYPAFLTTGLPPPDLAFSYPPHVEIVKLQPADGRFGYPSCRRHDRAPAEPADPGMVRRMRVDSAWWSLGGPTPAGAHTVAAAFDNQACRHPGLLRIRARGRRCYSGVCSSTGPAGRAGGQFSRRING
jgi:hypothetical protein